MKFYDALKMCIEQGKRISREDWNGKGVYVYYVPSQKIHIDNYAQLVGVPDDLTEREKNNGFVTKSGHFVMMNAQGIRIIGWSATQTDLVSDEWMVIE